MVAKRRSPDALHTCAPSFAPSVQAAAAYTLACAGTLALAVAAAGVALGSSSPSPGTRVLAGLLHGVTPLDAVAFGATVTGITTVAVVAACAPARQAARVAPVEMLTAE